MLGSGAVERKIKLKLMILLYDLVLNDDGIDTNRPFYVRDQLCEDMKLINHLLLNIWNANVEAP